MLKYVLSIKQTWYVKFFFLLMSLFGQQIIMALHILFLYFFVNCFVRLGNILEQPSPCFWNSVFHLLQNQLCYLTNNWWEKWWIPTFAKNICVNATALARILTLLDLTFCANDRYTEHIQNYINFIIWISFWKTYTK